MSLNNNVLSDPVVYLNVTLITQAELARVCSKKYIYISDSLCFTGAETLSQKNILNSDALPKRPYQPVNIKNSKTKVDHQ